MAQQEQDRDVNSAELGPSPDAWLSELNPQQRQAATAGEGPVLVIAGAGTGKTKTLAYRVAWLIAQGIDPQRIMLLTFTRRAADEMLRRASAIVGRARPDAAGAVHHAWGGTFHSVGNRLLRHYGQAIGLDLDFTVIDQGDAQDLMHVVRNELGLASREQRFPRKNTCLAIYSRVVNSGDSLADTLKQYFPWCRDHCDDLKRLFAAYVDAKQQRNVLDYDDLLLFWRGMLDDEDLAGRIEERFDHILVDEYQDTNRLQAGILAGMRRANKNLTVVGDDAQSIYSFRAADVGNILDFPGQFPGTARVTLEQNYRSRQPILDATNQVIARSPRRHAKNLWSGRGGRQKPYLVTCEREEDQTDFVVQKVLEHLEQGIPLRRQAVLFRVGHWSDHLEVELGRRKIPYHKYGGLKFLEAAHVKDLMAFLRVLENPRDQLAWSRLLNLLEGVGPATAARAFEHVRDAGFDPRALATLTKVPPAAADQVADLAGTLAALARAGRDLGIGAQVEHIRKFYDPIFEKVYENPEPRRRDLEHLEQVANNYTSRERFLTDLTIDPPISTGDFAGPPVLDEDWLTLSTIHSAKGMEWDAVFLIHAADGILPSDMATGDAEQIEEERRLLYVACTRAKDWLYVTHPLRYYVKKAPLGDAHGYAQLTRFIPPAVKEYFEPASRTRPQSEDDPDRPSSTTAGDIRKNIRAMWE